MIHHFVDSYDFLSNFYPGDNTSLEHKYQAEKTDDPDWKKYILAADTPGKAKKRGRCAPMRPSWDVEKINVMRRLVRKKFSDPILREKLLATCDHQLIEGNWWGDTFWGVCNGVGMNWLGRILMEVRAELLNDVN